MSDPAFVLQDAVFDHLWENAAVRALVGANVFDRVPAATDPFPRITIGRDQILDDGDSCGDAWQAAVTIHAWSRKVGMPELKRIAGAVRDALAVPLTITGFRTISGLHRDTLYLDDPDKLSTHAVLTFEYLIDTAD